MDYEDEAFFDYVPSVCYEDVNFYLTTRCHTNISGRSAAGRENRNLDKYLTNVSAVNASEISDNHTDHYLDESSLSEQIQQASGTSYSNDFIESNFSNPMKANGNIRSSSIDSDSFRAVTASASLNPMPEVSQNLKPASKPSSTKRRKPGFRKLEINSSDERKTVNEVFKTQQSFNPDSWKKTDDFRLGSKCDFPGL